MPRLCYILCVLAAVLLFAACTPRTDAEDGVLSLSPMVVQLLPAQTYTLLLSSTPVSLAEQVEWVVEDTTIAAVSSAGVVTARSEGQTHITATAGGCFAECWVVVTSSTDSVPVVHNFAHSQVRPARSAKRGVGFGSPFLQEDVYLLSPYLSWAYNWGATLTGIALTSFDQTSLEFCPMAWNKGYNKESIRAYKQTHPDCRYLLAYNEPNLTDQANLTPAEAAEGWSDLVAFAHETGLLLVSPAMNYGTLSGYTDPVKWLDEFFSLVGGTDDIAAIALHCYMSSAGALKSFIDRFDKYNKPIWLTEFCAWNASTSSAAAQQTYMTETIPMLEQDGRVARYAWFLARNGGGTDASPYNALVNDADVIGLTPLGKLYAGLYTGDTTYLDIAYPLLLNNCTNLSTIANGGTAPHFYPTQDSYASLYMQLATDQFAEYHIEATAVYSRLALCYHAYMRTTLVFTLDGREYSAVLPRTQDTEWHTLSMAMPIEKGQHTLRITNRSGNTLLYWLKGIR